MYVGKHDDELNFLRYWAPLNARNRMGLTRFNNVGSFCTPHQCAQTRRRCNTSTNLGALHHFFPENPQRTSWHVRWAFIILIIISITFMLGSITVTALFF